MKILEIKKEIFERTFPDLDEVGVDRVHGRAVRDFHTVWRFPGYDHWVCEECSCGWAVDWGVG